MCPPHSRGLPLRGWESASPPWKVKSWGCQPPRGAPPSLGTQQGPARLRDRQTDTPGGRSQTGDSQDGGAEPDDPSGPADASARGPPRRWLQTPDTVTAAQGRRAQREAGPALLSPRGSHRPAPDSRASRLPGALPGVGSQSGQVCVLVCGHSAAGTSPPWGRVRLPPRGEGGQQSPCLVSWGRKLDPQDAPGTLDSRATGPGASGVPQGWRHRQPAGRSSDPDSVGPHPCDQHTVLAPPCGLSPGLRLALEPPSVPLAGRAAPGAGAQHTSPRSRTRVCPVPSEHRPPEQPCVPQGLPTALPRAPERRSAATGSPKETAMLGNTFSVNTPKHPLSLGTSARRTVTVPPRDLASQNTWPQAAPPSGCPSRRGCRSP